MNSETNSERNSVADKKELIEEVPEAFRAQSQIAEKLNGWKDKVDLRRFDPNTFKLRY